MTRDCEQILVENQLSVTQFLGIIGPPAYHFHSSVRPALALQPADNFYFYCTMHLFIWILPYQINFSNSGCQYWLKSEIKFLVLALYNLTKKEEFPNIVISGIKDPATCFSNLLLPRRSNWNGWFQMKSELLQGPLKENINHCDKCEVWIIQCYSSGV